MRPYAWRELISDAEYVDYRVMVRATRAPFKRASYVPTEHLIRAGCGLNFEEFIECFGLGS